MANYGNMPYALGHYYKRRRRRRQLFGAGLGLGGTAALFGTRGGRRVVGKGLQLLPAGFRQRAATGLRPMFRGMTAAKRVARRGALAGLWRFGETRAGQAFGKTKFWQNWLAPKIGRLVIR